MNPIPTLARWAWRPLAVAAAGAAGLILIGSASATHLSGGTATYTLDADFAEGSLINVQASGNQLQLDSSRSPLNFIWVAVSTKGTIVKINTTTGAVLGEYRTAPQGQPTDPSRTTVDNDGNVWVSNRAQGSTVAANAIAPGLPAVTRAMGSIAHIGLVENGECVDRNGNGVIETSTGLGDIRAWPNTGSVNTLGGVSTAADECILHYTRTNSAGARHISVTASNDVWISGTSGQRFDLVSGVTGQIIRQEASVGYGGYGGLIDANGVIWSARPLLRWDTALPLTGANGDPAGNNIGPNTAGTNWAGQSTFDSYGLCINPNNGDVWNTRLSQSAIDRYAANGTYLGSYAHGSPYAQGCAVDSNGHVWVAHSILGSQNTVGHLNASGTFLGNVTVGTGPTGVSVDAVGKVWATNYNSRTVSRIDPALAGGVGAVDLTTVDLGGNLYNYSDMTGSTLTSPANTGTWTVVHDTGVAGADWGTVSWNAATPGNSAVTVTVQSSDNGTTWSPTETATNGGSLVAPNGRYLRVVVKFDRASTDGNGDGVNDSPVLYDLTVASIPKNKPPTAVAGGPYTVPEGSSIALSGAGSSDPDGDPLTFAWDLDNNGTYETAGVAPTFSAAGKDGPSSQVVGLQVCDPLNACDTTQVTVLITNVAPVANAGAPLTVYRNDPVALSGTFTDPAAALDAPFAWTWDTNGDGTADSNGATGYGSAVAANTTFATQGTYSLKFGVTDKDGGNGLSTVVVTVLNRAPVCSAATPSVASIWPPNHKLVKVNILGVTDAEGDTVTIVITGIRQDEPLNTLGDGTTEIDAAGIGTSTAEVRAERSGTPKVPGNGRVYHISFTADDGHGGSCTGTVRVGVPHDQGKGTPAIDDGPLYNSVAP